MKIHDDHLYHGAALIQVAEQSGFTAINSLKTGSITHRNAYRINNEIALYLKYASTKTKSHNEYIFSFSKDHRQNLKKIAKANSKTFIALVCAGDDREICCLSYEQFKELVAARREAKGEKEDQYSILVKIEARKSLRVYVNDPGRRNSLLCEMTINRNDFPSKLFA